MIEEYKKFKVYLRSVPGFYEQYDGSIDVLAIDSEQAIEKAFRQLKRTTFSDRTNSMWSVEKVEIVY
jgi:hypothetical protein